MSEDQLDQRVSPSLLAKLKERKKDFKHKRKFRKHQTEVPKHSRKLDEENDNGLS